MAEIDGYSILRKKQPKKTHNKDSEQAEVEEMEAEIEDGKCTNCTRKKGGG
jgi:hypothetical protein